eukprot:TRINITY_DN49762_c0_g1_i2.p1 TRINITY_DN49762_c0_g1~~TRINITY_DN49762_c0_g1_i2.p1  ORF type:complete len:451 (+),score=142.27 TRINITY_DN49762_c0_g1_i2:119-1471(+)
MIRRPPRSTLSSSSAASDVYKRQVWAVWLVLGVLFAVAAMVGVMMFRRKLMRGGVIRGAPEGPLKGVVVLDCSVVVAGPMACSILSELGAEVIKVESMRLPDSSRGLGQAPSRGMASIWMLVNRGKQSICIDTQTDHGCRAMERLVKRADVLLQNFRPGGAESAGYGWEQCHEWNPELIYCSSLGFGEAGPCSNHRVYDMLIQMLSGFTHIQGNHDKPLMAPGFFFDKAQALANAQGILAALCARQHGAGGQHVKVDMLNTALQMLWPDGYQDHVWLDGCDPDVKEPPVMDKLVPGQADMDGDALGIKTAEQAMADPEILNRMDRVSHFMFGDHWAAKLPMVFDKTPVDGPRPAAPMIGEHSVKLLKEMGFKPSEIQAMLDPANGNRGLPAVVAFKQLPSLMAKPAVENLRQQGKLEEAGRIEKKSVSASSLIGKVETCLLYTSPSPRDS